MENVLELIIFQSWRNNNDCIKNRIEIIIILDKLTQVQQINNFQVYYINKEKIYQHERGKIF